MEGGERVKIDSVSGMDTGDGLNKADEDPDYFTQIRWTLRPAQPPMGPSR
jgi:hypothetical protein